MTVENYKDGKLITLSKAFDTRPKMLNAFYFLMFTALAVAAFNMTLAATSLSIVGVLFFMVMMFVYFLIGYRFINKSLQTEKLIVNKEYFTIVKTGLLSKQERRFENKLISKFRHLDKPALTSHPIAGNSFDYMGFQTEQRVINEMHGDNRLAFDYNGRTITFGENVYSWEFEEFEALLYSVTGSYYLYDNSFEKTYGYDEDDNLNQAANHLPGNAS